MHKKVPKVLRPQVLNWSSKCTQKVLKVLEFLRRSSRDTQIVLNVLKNLSTSSKSSVGNQVRKDPQYPEKSLKSSKASGPQKVTRSHQMFLKCSSMFWEHQVLRSSKSPQKVHKVLKRSRKCTKGTQGTSDLRFSTDPQNVLKFLKRSSKPSKSSEVHKRYSRRPQSPQKVINVLKIL